MTERNHNKDFWVFMITIAIILVSVNVIGDMLMHA